MISVATILKVHSECANGNVQISHSANFNRHQKNEF